MTSRNIVYAAAGRTVTTDPYFEYVSMLVPGNGTNGVQNNTFIDGSSNALTITRNGNTTQGSFTPYGTLWSNYFDGSGDYISVNDASAIEVGANDFTMECWIYLTGYSSNYGGAYVGGLFYKSVSGSRSYEFTINGTSSSWTSLQFWGYDSGGSGANIGATYTFNLNTWYHVACVRNGNNVYLYVDGVQKNVTTSFTKTINDATSALKIGGANFDATYGFYLPGYISNARLVVGTAVYTGAFTPPTAPLTAITNTSLLTCQSNRFIDNSANAFAITVNGDVTVRPFSPFLPTTPYSTVTNGGSGYFDGSGDYLSVADNSAFPSGTDSATFEAWVYVTVGGVNQCVLSKTSTNAVNFAIYINTSNQVLFAVQGYADLVGSTLLLNTWTHLAVSYDGTTATMYVNGVSVASGARVLGSTSNPFYVGALDPGNLSFTFPFNGYICDARVIKGTAVYTTNFTPPTAPLTAISGTAILCSFTNAGIFTYAPMVNFGTNGNAQISTTSPKFGTGSVYFDGTGTTFLTMPLCNELNFGTGPFTVEFWMKSSGTQTTYSVITDRSTNAPGLGTDFTGSVIIANGTYWADKINFRINNTTEINSTTSVNDGNWHHVACVRLNSTTMYVFVDGNLEASSTSVSSTATASMSGARIGKSEYSGDSADNQYTGYIDDFRVTKGIARYTANFTPPTQAFPTY